MTSGLLYSTRSIAGREGKGIIAHMTVLESQCSSTDLLAPKKTEAGKKLIEAHGNMKINKQINPFGEFYLRDAVTMSDWITVYNNIDVSALREYDNLYLIGGIDLWRSNLTRKGNRIGKFPYDSGQLKFQSVGIHLCHLLGMLKAHREYGIALHELAYDPNEMAINLFHNDVAPNSNYYVYHGYDIPSYGINRLDSLQYHFSSLSPSIFESEKQYDFTFGYSVLEKSGREKYISYISRLASSVKNSNVYVKNALTGEDTTLDRDQYLDKIKQSRYTLMLPSYDNHCFSIYRFIESLYNDCLPLIHPDCNITNVQQSYDVDLSKLVASHFFEEAERIDILETLKAKILPFNKGFL